MSVAEILLFVLLGFWIVLHLMSIDDDVRAIKYEQREIYQLLEYYLLKREVEREKKNNE